MREGMHFHFKMKIGCCMTLVVLIVYGIQCFSLLLELRIKEFQ